MSVTLDAQERPPSRLSMWRYISSPANAEAGEVEAYLKELGFGNCKAVKGENNA